MVRRLCDVVCAAAALAVLAPAMLAAMVAVRLSSPGPMIHRATRVGRHGRPFTLYKIRTMHVASETLGPITASDDARTFRVGAWLRSWKVDELPQLVNVLAGDMAIIGPRPEDPLIVRDHFTPVQRQTLTVRPGLASPDSLYNYTHGEAWLRGAEATDTYVRELLPLKLALDLEYVQHASLWYDMRLVGRTLSVVAARACGRREFADPPELLEVIHGRPALRPRARALPREPS